MYSNGHTDLFVDTQILELSGNNYLKTSGKPWEDSGKFRESGKLLSNLLGRISMGPHMSHEGGRRLLITFETP